MKVGVQLKKKINKSFFFFFIIMNLVDSALTFNFTFQNIFCGT